MGNNPLRMKIGILSPLSEVARGSFCPPLPSRDYCHPPPFPFDSLHLQAHLKTPPILTMSSNLTLSDPHVPLNAGPSPGTKTTEPPKGSKDTLTLSLSLSSSNSTRSVQACPTCNAALVPLLITLGVCVVYAASVIRYGAVPPSPNT